MTWILTGSVGCRAASRRCSWRRRPRRCGSMARGSRPAFHFIMIRCQRCAISTCPSSGSWARMISSPLLPRPRGGSQRSRKPGGPSRWRYSQAPTMASTTMKGRADGSRVRTRAPAGYLAMMRDFIRKRRLDKGYGAEIVSRPEHEAREVRALVARRAEACRRNVRHHVPTSGSSSSASQHPSLTRATASSPFQCANTPASAQLRMPTRSRAEASTAKI